MCPSYMSHKKGEIYIMKYIWGMISRWIDIVEFDYNVPISHDIIHSISMTKILLSDFEITAALASATRMVCKVSIESVL